ncbi:CKLF-like MARVEL transmembrane domain-containing protein 2 isoform X1 [Globicephala melas]|uniref:CKLF-like MARVEL transmembrane domain-containing protein 2 isoform X1 n=1 Tax=Globicephala melas TaxID=9731 RepID=UPI00122EE6EB|nr:CKLF-like MARVEL transmembrane domain-containing protein 2 isoform X1 [Globicephala melas]
MADKGKKGKPGATAAAAAAAAAAAPGAAPPPGDEVGRRKGWCRRYKLEVKNSNREFWLNGYAEVKLIILGCLIGSLMMFKGTTVHPHVTLIITMELSILIFFIIIYTFAIQRYTLFILWPISDLLNDLSSSAFLVGAALSAVKTRQTMPMHYIYGVILIGVAALVALIDVCLQMTHFKGKKVKAGVRILPRKDKKGKKPKEGEKPEEAGKGRAAVPPPAKGGKGGGKK